MHRFNGTGKTYHILLKRFTIAADSILPSHRLSYTTSSLCKHSFSALFHNFINIWFHSLQRVLHSMLCSRVLLHIRGAYTNRGFVMSSDIEESRNGAGFSFRKPHRHTFNEGDSAFALTGNLSPGHARFSAIGYPTPPTSASKEEFEMIGWGRGRGYADNNVFHSRAFDVPSCEYIVSPVNPSERSRSRTPSSVWP